MILVIDVCADKLHNLEFVKPIEDILTSNNVKFVTRHYSKINKNVLDKSKKIIICGTSLQDNKFAEDIFAFDFLKNYKKPVLGICAGMQIILSLFGGKLRKKQEIGFYKETFKKEFLGLKGEEEVYHLHDYYSTVPDCFEVYAGKKIAEAVNYKNFYGVLFHPEVRQRLLIKNFSDLN